MRFCLHAAFELLFFNYPRSGHGRAVRPADLHVGPTVQRMVEQVGEVEVVAEQRRERGAGFLDIRLQTGAGYREKPMSLLLSWLHVLADGEQISFAVLEPRRRGGTLDFDRTKT